MDGSETRLHAVWLRDYHLVTGWASKSSHLGLRQKPADTHRTGWQQPMRSAEPYTCSPHSHTFSCFGAVSSAPVGINDPGKMLGLLAAPPWCSVIVCGELPGEEVWYLPQDG